MAFTFQMNHSIKFNHDEGLLKKAELLTPPLINKEKKLVRLGELTKDITKFEGWTIKTLDMKIDDKEYKKDDSLILDFGNHYVGRFAIDINSVGSPMDAPLYIRLRFAEVVAELSHESEEYDGWLARGWIQEEFIHLDELPTLLSLPRRYAFRYVEIKVLDTSPKWSVVFSNPRLITESCVDSDNLPFPKIEDMELAAIYQVGLKTLEDCMTDVFEDGPKRDRRLWLGDLRLQALANYESFKQNDLVKRCLYLFGAMTTEDGRISANVFTKPYPIPDDTFLFEYSLFFISVLHDYLAQEDDEELLGDLYPIAKKQINTSLTYIQEDGKVCADESYPVFVDWSTEFDKTTCLQAIMIYVLRQFIELAQKAGDFGITEYYESVLDKLVNYSKNNLFDSEKNLFKTEKVEYNIASQVWMVLAGVFPKEMNRKIMMTTIEKLFPIKNIATPYMYHHVTEALFVAGLKEEATELMKNYWGQMIRLGADTFWEAFDPDKPDYSPYGSPIISSYCHAWSCTPVYLISKYLHREE